MGAGGGWVQSSLSHTMERHTHILLVCCCVRVPISAVQHLKRPHGGATAQRMSGQVARLAAGLVLISVKSGRPSSSKLWRKRCIHIQVRRITGHSPRAPVSIGIRLVFLLASFFSRQECLTNYASPNSSLVTLYSNQCISTVQLRQIENVSRYSRFYRKRKKIILRGRLISGINDQGFVNRRSRIDKTIKKKSNQNEKQDE